MFINNKLLGAVLITTSTCIGASMVSLPMISVSIGTLSTFLLLFVIWALAYNVSIINTNISLFYQGSFSISKLCQKSLPYYKVWIIADVLIITLFYLLLSAYMSALISISDLLLGNSRFLIGKQFFGYITIIVLLLFIVINFQFLDIGNKFIFFIKIIIFIIIIYCLSSQVGLTNIRRLQYHIIIDDNFFKAIPIFFTSFGFHGSIPFIIKYLDYNRQDIKKAFFWGSFISLLIYLLWTFFTLSTLTTNSMNCILSMINTEINVNSFISILVQDTNHSSLNYLIIIFTWLTIITSFLGVGVGLYDYFLEKLRSANIEFITKLKFTTITFLPPFLIAYLGKDIFLHALAIAAISLVFLAIIFPCFIALKIKKGKKINIVASLTLGLFIVAVEIYNFLH